MQQATGAVPSSGLRAHSAASTVTLGNGLDLAANGSSVVTANGMRYVMANLRVRNAQSCSTPGTCTAYTAASHNLTLVAAETSSSISQTAVSKMKLFDGSNAAASIATTVVPTDGVASPNTASGAVRSADGEDSLEVFSEAEVAGMTKAAGVTSLLPYGYAVKNLDDPTTRALPGSPASNDYEGAVTVAVAFPVQSSATANPFSISLVLQVVDDSNTRVTQSKEDDTQRGDAVSGARAAAISSTDLAVLGNNHVTSTNAGHPICTVRTAGTAAAPTAYLVNNGSANLASLPYNLQSLQPLSAVQAGFCQAMKVTGATYSQFVVSGSQTAQRLPTSHYSGSFGATPNGITFYPTGAFFTGERVSFSVTSSLTSATGNQHPQGFVGQSWVGGATPSSGLFAGYSQNGYNLGTSSHAWGIATGDVNGDGIPDLVEDVTDSSSSGAEYAVVELGNGDGTFGAPVAYASGATNYTDGVSLGDVNGDGSLDIVLNANAQTTVFLNNGDGTFGAAIPTAHPGTGYFPSDPALADFDNDGHLDVALPDNSNKDYLVLMGKGDGTFSTKVVTTAFTSDQLVTADLNGDGIPDLALSNPGDSSTNGYIDVEYGNGDGTFQAPYAIQVGVGDLCVAAVDWSGDGNVDLATYNGGSGTLSRILNQGTNNFFVNSTATGPSGGVYCRDLRGVALTPGGRQDLVMLDTNSNLDVFRNTGGTFANATTVAAPSGSFFGDIATGDFNGDGAPDVARTSYTRFDVFSGDGAGGLSIVSRLGQIAVPEGSGLNSSAVGDFNEDGKLDLVTANAGLNLVRVSVGSGSGGFLGGGQASTSASPIKVLTADFDGDGHLDVAVLEPSAVQIFSGSGTGSLTSRATIPVSAGSSSMAVGDVNADGRPDLVVMSATGASTVLTNDGAFAFDSASLTGSPSAYSVDLADLNGDGALDVVYGNGSSIYAAMGNGDGTFALPVLVKTIPSNGPVRAIAVADFNGDGIPDIAAIAGRNQVSVLYRLPDGALRDSEVATLVAGTSLAVGDLNGDGSLDLVVGGAQLTLLQQGPAGLALSPHPTVRLAGAAGTVVLGDFTGTHQLTAGYTVQSSGTFYLARQR